MNHPPLSDKALTILERRYLKKDDSGRVIETPEGMFRRVAHVVAQADLKYGNAEQAASSEEAFFNCMASRQMLPNSPTLMNAGNDLAQLSACFVLPVEDSIDSIFEAVKNMAKIHKSGGGTGFSFSRLRPKNDTVGSTKGISSGPASFMSVFDAATSVVKQGGMRRGANMGVLTVNHPDILEFISCKRQNNRLQNFNISVGITESFIEAVKNNSKYPLLNPRTGKAVDHVQARPVLHEVIESAWESGEPGILFLDRINRDNPTPFLGAMDATNPCGEVPLLPYESCNLASLNLSAILKDGVLDWEKLKRNVHLAVHFLDNVIDLNSYPLEQVRRITLENRKIGLGVMGFADLLIKMEILYDSDQAVGLASQIMAFISQESVRASEKLAQIRGAFPNFKESVFAKKGLLPRRNATTTTIAPTGTISLIAGCSSGIEPLFALAFRHNVLEEDGPFEVNPLFQMVAEREGFWSEGLLEKVLATGSVRHLDDDLPDHWKRIFSTSHEVSPEWHIQIQAAFQKHTDNAVSKTVNLPSNATKDTVRDAFLLAHELGCKGVTIYRDGSRSGQILQKHTPTQQTSSSESAVHRQNDPSGPLPRPKIMLGATRRMNTGCGSLYVTVNFDDNRRPFEVFTSMGKAGGCASSQSEAIGRLVSLALRSGISPEQVVKQLRGISCHLPKGFGPAKICSCADAVAQALKQSCPGNHVPESAVKLLTKKSNHTIRPDHPSDAPSDQYRILLHRGLCPACKGPLAFESACLICKICGFSECF